MLVIAVNQNAVVFDVCHGRRVSNSGRFVLRAQRQPPVRDKAKSFRVIRTITVQEALPELHARLRDARHRPDRRNDARPIAGHDVPRLLRSIPVISADHQGVTTQHTFFAQLRHGSTHPARGTDECLLAVTGPLRKQRPGIAINVRAETSMCTRLTCGVSLPIGTGYSETRELAGKVLVCRDRQQG
jgi:hypothetical protein